MSILSLRRDQAPRFIEAQRTKRNSTLSQTALIVKKPASVVPLLASIVAPPESPERDYSNTFEVRPNIPNERAQRDVTSLAMRQSRYASSSMR